jgi:hypothetical protein
VRPHDLACDRKPEPVALARAAVAAPVEALKQAGDVVGWDPAPGIAHGHLHEAGRQPPARDADEAARRGVPEGVVEQVVQHLFEAVEVPPHAGRAFGPQFEADPAFLAADREHFAHVVEQLMQVDGLLAHP